METRASPLERKIIWISLIGTKLSVAAVTWEKWAFKWSWSNFKKKDQNKLIRLAQIRNMKSSYQMDSSHSRQRSESRGQERGRLGGGCPSKCKWLPAADWSRSVWAPLPGLHLPGAAALVGGTFTVPHNCCFPYCWEMAPGWEEQGTGDPSVG